MVDLKTKITTAIATGAVVASALAPLASATDQIVVSGNGRDSTSTATVSQSNTTTVEQTNNATVQNNITSTSNSGENRVSDNGGNVDVNTGNATANTTVNNTLNSNSASVTSCNCATGGSVAVSGNLRDSSNTVNVSSNNTNGVFQTNNATVTNNVTSNANSGENRATDNLGDVTIHTGAATTNTSVSTTANANSASLGSGGNGGAGWSAFVVGNGRDSYNSIDLDLSNSATVEQTNNADVTNNVTSNAKSGGNRSSDNLGSTDIHTGDATANTTVRNALNFNSADLGSCGCTTGGLLAKIANNLRGSDNEITADLGNDQGVFQTNNANLENNATANAKSGFNVASDNGGGLYLSDPPVHTGAATDNTTVNNAGNQNVLGSGATAPTWTFGGMNFTFDMGAWNAFMSWFSTHSM